MKNFLSQKRALSLNNATRRVRSAPSDFCNGCEYLTHYQSNPNDERIPSLEATKCLCVDNPYQGFIIIGDGLTIEGYGTNGKKLDPVKNAWGASAGTFKISAEKTTEITYYIGIDSQEQEPDNIRHQIVVLKKNWEGKIRHKYDISTNAINNEGEALHFVAPNKVTLTYKTDDKANCRDGYNKKFTDGTAEGEYLYLSVSPSGYERGKTGKFEGELEVTSSVPNAPSYYPDKVFEVKPNMIFSAAVPDYEFMEGGGLSGGAIAGIVIACIVVVGVVVFCVVWFVVLKKSCPCGSGGGKESAEA